MLQEPKFIDKIWPVIWPLIEGIVVLESPDDILADLKAERRFLLVIGDGAAIVRPCGTSTGKFLEINYVGGENAKEWWPQMSKAIDVIAKTLDASKIIAFGRSAWKRLAPDYTATEQRMYMKDVA